MPVKIKTVKHTQTLSKSLGKKQKSSYTLFEFYITNKNVQ